MQHAPTFRALLLGTACAWRQWAFVKDGWAFVVVSIIHADNEAKLLPDVKHMLATFEVVPPANQSRGHSKP